MCLVPFRSQQSRLLQHSTDPGYSLVFILVEHSVSVELCSAESVSDKSSWSSLEEPAQRNYTFCHSTEMVEERRGAIALTDVVDFVRCSVQVCKELWGLCFGLLCLRRDKEIFPLGFKGFKDSF